MNLMIVLAVIAVMVVLRFLKVNILVWFVAWWAGIWVILSYAVNPPLPESIIVMFMFIVTLALLTYLSSNSEYLADTSQKLVQFMVDQKYTVPLILVLVALPALVAFRVYSNMTQQPQPPISTRTIHPSPPVQVSFKGKNIDLVNIENPYRELETSDAASFANHVANGRRVYYENCVYCHGDNMEGDGIYAHGFDPIPANFVDATTIAMLQESYLFWRIAKGAPGLPDESTPWASAMPAWEKFLTEEEIWDVIIFLYDFTDQRPRAKEELH
jgi:mono/diheme cytochrome c family protein